MSEAQMKTAIVILCVSLAGCYTPPKGTAKCEEVERMTYVEHLNRSDAFWANVYAGQAFDRCMKGA